jgi:hypothetical protein
LLIHWLGGLAPYTAIEALAIPLWQDQLDPADSRATTYGTRVRSVYIWIAFLTALSVALAVIAPFYNLEGYRATLLSLGEFVSLLMIAILLMDSRWSNWSQRWRDYRRLAEHFRAQQAITPLGETSQIWVRQVHDKRFAVPSDERQWVNWLSAAKARMARIGTSVFNAQSLERIGKRIDEFLGRQEDYHEAVANRTMSADIRSVAVDLAAFCIDIDLIWIKTRLTLESTQSKWLEMLVVVLLVLAINLAGIHAAIRFRLQADRSQIVRDAIQRARLRLTDVDLGRPLASQEVVSIARAVVATMVYDVQQKLAVSDD